MYDALLVDDEVHAVRGLQAGVHWDRLHVGSVYTAHSLKQAQEVFRSRSVHLMVCDIEMPQGSGLELAAWVKEHHPETKTIFLTCHSDFQFAKQAIQLDSFDYLLKPVDYSELESVIGRAFDKMAKERELRFFEKTYHHYKLLWESHQPVVAELFWQDLVQRKIPSNPEALFGHMRKAGLAYPESIRFLPVYTRVQRWRKELSERDRRIMEYALRNVLEEMMESAPGAAVIPAADSSFLTVIPLEAPVDEAETREHCDAFILNCNQYLFCDISCYVGDRVPLYELAGMLRSLQRLDENNVTQINRTFILGEAKKKESRLDPAPLAGWAEWMKQGARDKLSEQVSKYLASWNEFEGSIDAQALHAFYQDFLQTIFFVLQSKGLQANHVFAQSLLTDKPESVLRSLASLQEWVKDVIEVAMNRIHAIEQNLSVVDKVKRFIAEQIGRQDLSREDIARHVFLNPDYLSRIFKKETGMSLSDFLQQSRIEYAKELLANTCQSVSDIAVASGYSNLSYFSTIFKKATGVNPVDYRKRTLQN
ncbi:helix-turn-helix domain-containing protein [Paenibacillus arenilitoris]|uniref:Helix-turn-helix domain-containing protein n=1 Tax=Paenibacillus arenilitoris TaxID=2772299 RepID=A0A927CFH6_9BACL|nr:helix-turn-helix domain-containing protein [Paenibacillus arenilitoris]MBD2867119.1 helix-turn-helix domain-containing protein [Paenibacillus arenilitoris]